MKIWPFVTRAHAEKMVTAERQRAIDTLDNLHCWTWFTIDEVSEPADGSQFALGLEQADRAIRDFRDNYDHALDIDWCARRTAAAS
jgi:hypothetical protein